MSDTLDYQFDLADPGDYNVFCELLAAVFLNRSVLREPWNPAWNRPQAFLVNWLSSHGVEATEAEADRLLSATSAKARRDYYQAESEFRDALKRMFPDLDIGQIKASWKEVPRKAAEEDQYDRQLFSRGQRSSKRNKKSKPKPALQKLQRRQRDGVMGIPLVLLLDHEKDDIALGICEGLKSVNNDLLMRQFSYYENTKRWIGLKGMEELVSKWRRDPKHDAYGLPAKALEDLLHELDHALAKKRGFGLKGKNSRGSFYVEGNQAASDNRIWIVDNMIKLPILGLVAFRKRTIPEGRIMSGYVQQNGSGWRVILRIVTVQQPLAKARSSADAASREQEEEPQAYQGGRQ